MKKNNVTQCYSLWNSVKYSSFFEANQKMNNIYRILKRLSKVLKFKDIRFVIGISNTTSDTAKKEFINNGKRGRPVKVILGCKMSWHMHIYIFNKDENSYLLSSFCDSAIMRLKKYSIKIKSANDNLKVALEYFDKQCQRIVSNLNKVEKEFYFHDK